MLWIAYFLAMGYLIYLLVYFIRGEPLPEKERKENAVLFFLLKHVSRNKAIRLVLIYFCSLTLIFGMIFGISYIPRGVQQDLQGIEFLVTKSYEGEYLQIEELQKVNIHIDGRIRNGMFSTPRFQGFIELDIYPFTVGTRVWTNFSRDCGGESAFIWGHLVYWNVPFNRPNLTGNFHASDARFSSFLVIDNIRIYTVRIDRHCDLERRMIVAPAIDFDSAQDVMQTLGMQWSGIITIPAR